MHHVASVTGTTELWIAAAIGPLAWIVDLAINDARDRPADASFVLAASGIAFAIALLGGIVGWRALVRMPNDGSSRLRFLAHATIALSGISMLLVLATAGSES